MGVKLRENVKQTGVKSLFLDITINGHRYKEYLGLHLLPAKDAVSRTKNKETKRLAEVIRANKEIELQTREYNYTPQFKKNVDFIEYYSKFVKDYTHKDIRIVKYSLEWFKTLVEKENIKTIRPFELTPELCKKYLDLLQQNLHGETPYNYFTKFKRVVRQAYREKLIGDDPTESIKVIRDESLKKDILSFEEIQKLANGHCGNQYVKRAFLFCLNTGMRWCDIVKLQYKNIDYSNKRLTYTQEKTKHSSRNSTVTIDMNSTCMKLLGDKLKPDDFIFILPSHAGCLKSLDTWAKNAGIDKKITWHCARHSFAVNLLGECKADIKTVASLLGHSGIKHTEKYTRAVDELKHKAVNSLPDIEIS